MNKTRLFKFYLLGATFLSLTSCGNSNVSSSEFISSNEEQQEKTITPGYSVAITKDNFFDYFHLDSGSTFLLNYRSDIKYNIDAEIKVITRSLYTCPELNDELESYSEKVILSTSISETEYASGNSSKFTEGEYVNHFVKPDEWGDYHYTSHIYKIEYEFNKIIGTSTFGPRYFDYEVIQLNKSNYSEYISISFNNSWVHNHKTNYSVRISDSTYNKVIYSIGLKFEFELICFNDDYSEKEKIDFSVSSFDELFFEFEVSNKWALNVKDVEGVIYVNDYLPSKA